MNVTDARVTYLVGLIILTCANHPIALIVVVCLWIEAGIKYMMTKEQKD